MSRAVLVLVALLCAAGVYAALDMPSALFPNTDFPRLVLLIDNGVVPAEQMAASLTRPLEEAMNGLPGIVRIKSVTSRGSCEINLFFDWSTNMVLALQLAQARLAQFHLPPTASVRRLERLTFAVFPVCGYSLTSPSLAPADLRDLAEYVVRPRLARLPGVANVLVAGGKVREFQVRVDPARLASRGVTVLQVADAVRNSNLINSPGLLEENHQLNMILVSGQVSDPGQLSAMVVGVVNGQPVKVGDVASVEPGVAPEYTLVSADGQSAALLNVLRQPSASIVNVTDEVDQELATIRPTLPAGVKVVPFYDQSLLVRASMRSVRDAIGLGLLLSTVIIFWFLGDWRTTLVAVLVIPVTLLTTFAAMDALGLTFDLMTMGGVAAAIGLVIDDAIVVVENLHAHPGSVGRAMREIAVPLVGSTLTPVVVFIPLCWLTGVTGVFFRSLAITLTVALLTSLGLALTFTPVLAQALLRSARERPLTRLTNLYAWVLRRALAWPWLVLLAVLGLLAASGALYGSLGSEFLPAFDEGAFVLDYVAPPGTSLTETDRMLRQVEAMLKACPEVESYSRRTGLQLGLAITEPNTGDFLVKLRSDRQRSTDQVTDDLRGQIGASLPALRVEFAGILSDLIGDLTSSPAPIEIRLFSPDKARLHRLAAQVAESIQKVPGVVDVFNGIVVSGPSITFQVDPDQAARLGVTPADVAKSVETMIQGDPVSAILRGDRLVPVRVLFPRASYTPLENLKAVLIRASGQGMFRLDQVARLAVNPGETEVERDGLRQSVAVTARLSGVDLGTAVQAIQGRLRTDLQAQREVTLEYGGLYREQQASFRQLAGVLAVALGLIFFTLVVEFRSFLEPLAIVAGAFLSLSGVLVGLWVTGKTLNVVSLMGSIMVVGIVAKNGILMLDAVDSHLRAGETAIEALVNSGRRRLRPVLMTSLAAILGMLPLALALGSGSEMLQPLAIAVIGGLSVALMFSLVVTPTVYYLLRRASQ